MQNEPLTIEWEFVGGQDSDARLLEVLKILINNENVYEESKETV